jgi:hypothetical protein
MDTDARSSFPARIKASRLQRRKRRVQVKMYQTILLCGHHAKLGQRGHLTCTQVPTVMEQQVKDTRLKAELGENLSKRNVKI